MALINKKIKILHQYHNNVFDMVKVLEENNEVVFLSYRTSRLVPGIRNNEPSTFRFIWPMYNPFKLSKLLGKDTDILVLKHINDPINFFPYILSWIKGVKCVVAVQRLTHKNFWGYRFLFRLGVRLLCLLGVRIMAVTQDSYEELSKTRLKTVYIPACIKASCWESVNDQTSHLSANQLSIITVAKYQKRKNIPLLVKAVAELVKKYPLMGFRLVIVGDLSIRKKSQDEFRRVKNLVKQYCLEDIIILRSNVSHKEMPAIYNQNNIFVLPAGSEPLGYAVLEAMASGKPVICSDQVGAVSYIEEGKNGYICEAGSLSSLVQSLEKFIRNNNEINIQKIEEFGRYGKTLVERNHSAGVFLNKFEELVCMK